MKIVLVTFSNSKCYEGQKKLIESAKSINTFNEYETWKYEDYIQTEFFKEHLNITSEIRGVGFWVWKPFIILEAMKRINDGDVIIYHDSGRKVYSWEFKKNIIPFIEKIKTYNKGLGVIFGPFNHGEYCKKDCLIKMNCDIPQYRKHKQLSATWGIWEKNTFTQEILNEWLQWNIHSSRIVTDDESKEPNIDNFVQHRHDQAILTNIILKRVFQKTYDPIFAPNGIYEKNINNFIHKPFIFVSIPKNASQSIHKMFGIKLKDHSGEHEMAICDNHCRAELLKQRYPKRFQTFFKFCVVRNPHERTKSWYVYHKKILKLKPYTIMDFNSWVLEGCPHHWKFQNGTNYQELSHLSPLHQYQFIYDNEHNLLVDKIIKFENFEKDFREVCVKIDYPIKQFEKVNTTNDSSIKYTDSAYEHIKTLFKKDFELFNY